MKIKIIVMLIALVFLVGCSKTDDKADDFIEGSSFHFNFVEVNDSVRDCGVQMGYLDNESYPDDYSLPYVLYVECGLCNDDCQFVYYVPSGFITHIYNSDGFLIGGFESPDECVAISKTYDDVEIDCREDFDEVIWRQFSQEEIKK